MRRNTYDLSDVGFDFWGAQGHGLVHLLLTSASELGFASDGEVRVSLPPLRMMTGPIQHFSSFLDAWRNCIFANLSEWKVFFWELSL